MVKAPCFVDGTRILLEGGETPVEALKVGDRVVLARGGTAPIKWIGWRSIDRAAMARSPELAPIRVARGAFGPDRPHRDLWLSPEHAVSVLGVLVPIASLVNGVSIAREPAPRDLTYYHVELDAHGVLLSEGLETESYLDGGTRSFFANNAGLSQAHPTTTGGDYSDVRGCAPRIYAGPLIDEVRRRLAARARFDVPLLSRGANCRGAQDDTIAA
jgi:hypothetical protein